MPYPDPGRTGTDLPVEGQLEAIERAVISGSLVLTAAPGAGKSSLVPFAVDAAIHALDRGDARDDVGRVMLLQPRRLAARATANRLAELLGEEVGQSIGITMRGDSRRGRRIEVVTEAILTQRLQRDPELAGVGAVIFDEFHERNLHSDLGLAMAIEARNTLRPDLRIVVMSATIDPCPIAALLASDHTAVTTIDVPGQVFPIETEHRHRPTHDRWAAEVAAATDDAASRVTGDVLVFVPGRFEIDDVISRLAPKTAQARVIGLHGSSPANVHREVLRPASHRRIIVATGIAETSVTIPGVEAVVDGGRNRRPKYDPGTATNHLVTEHVSRFSADQRRGRAGRTQPGICIRLWSATDHELLADQAAPEVIDGDPLVVAAELLRWGDPDGEHLPLLDTPEPGRLAAARQTMAWWGLTELSHEGGTPESPATASITELGRSVLALPVHPRVGALLATVDRSLRAHDSLAGIGLRAAAVLDHGAFPSTDDFEREVEQASTDRDIRRSIDRLDRAMANLDLPHTDEPASTTPPSTLGELLALAWPDRVAIRREPGAHRLLLAAGREVHLDRGTAMGRADAFVIVDSTVVESSGRVRRAVPIDRAAITRLHEPTHERFVEWDRTSHRIVASRQVRHGAIVLHAEPWPDPDPAAVQSAAADGVRIEGLETFAWSDAAQVVRRRMRWLHERDATWPDVSDEALLAGLDRWLDLSRVTTVNDLRKIDVGARLLDLLDWEQRRELDSLAPLSLQTPGGRTKRITWSGERPVWSVRLQDLFGLDEHPMIGPRPEPLTVELLSPAGRVAQTTTDLPGFWRGSYRAVRSDLRGRYPKHAWPEDPTT